MNESTQEFVRKMYAVHQDSRTLIHFAIDSRGRQARSTMPVTAFIYEFFLYNSLYSVNWLESLKQRTVISYPSKGKGSLQERPQQEKFELLLKVLAKNDPTLFRQGFTRITKRSLEGGWTKIKPDSKITDKAGDDFFSSFQKLQAVLANESFEESALAGVFTNIQVCRSFIYDVRCNIFHGNKRLGELGEDDQRRRVEVYHLFLRCIVDAFFNFQRQLFTAHTLNELIQVNKESSK